MATGTIISLGLYFVVMLGIGLFAYRQTDTNVEGYMLGGRQLGPAVTALSAGASDMSGWMLMGLPSTPSRLHRSSQQLHYPPRLF